MKQLITGFINKVITQTKRKGDSHENIDKIFYYSEFVYDLYSFE